MELKEYITKVIEALPKGAVIDLEIAIMTGPKQSLQVDACEDHDAVNKLKLNMVVG